MQSNVNNIYKLTSQRTGIPEELYKEIGDVVFKELVDSIKKPKTLIVRLRGVGSWFLRRSRMKAQVQLYNPGDTPPVNVHPTTLDRYYSKLEQHLNFIERIKEYEIYSEERAKIRKIRNETQTILEPSPKED